jgi:hypothetical protein
MIGSTVPTVTIFTIRETLRESGQHLIAVNANVAKTSKKQRVEMLHKRPDLGAVDGHRIGVKSFFIF